MLGAVWFVFFIVQSHKLICFEKLVCPRKPECCFWQKWNRFWHVLWKLLWYSQCWFVIKMVSYVQIWLFLSSLAFAIYMYVGWLIVMHFMPDIHSRHHNIPSQMDFDSDTIYMLVGWAKSHPGDEKSHCSILLLTLVAKLDLHVLPDFTSELSILMQVAFHLSLYSKHWHVWKFLIVTNFDFCLQCKHWMCQAESFRPVILACRDWLMWLRSTRWTLFSFYCVRIYGNVMLWWV